MTMKTTRRAFGVGAAACLLATTALAQDAPTFALVQINQQALFFNEMNRGAQEAAEAAGVNLVIFNANNDLRRRTVRSRPIFRKVLLAWPWWPST